MTAIMLTGKLPLVLERARFGGIDMRAQAEVRSALRIDTRMALSFCGNTFRHLAFHLGSWVCQPVVVTAPLLFDPWFVSIASVSHSMYGNCIEQVVAAGVSDKQ
jgi:hypothetical protein